MPKLRVVSWNIRTLGTQSLRTEDLRRIAAIILESKADIICIQEVMIGSGVVGDVGAQVGPEATETVSDIAEALYAADPGAGWWWDVSGADSGVSDHMRDAYAFIYKETPSRSQPAYRHDSPVDGIEALCDSVILRQQPRDAFPGRRPGMLIFNVTTATGVTPVNIISYHARTPTNRFSKTKGSGYGINALATLPEVGGGMHYGTGHKWSWTPSVMPLPQVDTIIVGDFNFTMDHGWAQFTYNNLLTNYQACISSPDNVLYTTYAPSGTQAFRLVSAYDNIFVLRPHQQFKPAVTFTGSKGTIDFILADSETLGGAIGVFPYVPDIGTQTAWYVIHKDQYKRQHAVRGISDHLPVWADFAIGAQNSTASHILPTSEANNNCLLHAMFGAPTAQGVYVDAGAVARRQALVTALTGYRTASAFPYAVRRPILSAMINEFDADAAARTLLGRLLVLPTVNPFNETGFPDLYRRYLVSISAGRMLYVHEAEVLAFVNNLTVGLHYVDRGQYYGQVLNPGQGQTVDIYHQALHFCRWQP